MSSQYYIFAKCTETGKLVNTGAKAVSENMEEIKDMFVTFNCSSCNNAHGVGGSDVGVEIRLIHE